MKDRGMLQNYRNMFYINKEKNKTEWNILEKSMEKLSQISAICV